MKYVKNLFFCIVVALLLYILYSYLNNDEIDSTRTSTFDNSINREVLKVIQTEPKIKEAIITDTGVLYVSVINDGTSRDGYAAYLCEIVREYRGTIERVKVVQVNTTNHPHRDNAYGILLGETWCQ